MRRKQLVTSCLPPTLSARAFREWLLDTTVTTYDRTLRSLLSPKRAFDDQLYEVGVAQQLAE